MNPLCLFVTVFIASLAGQALGQSQCTTTSWGELTTTAHPLMPANLDPAVPDWNVEVPVPPGCEYGVTGVLVTSCDSDQAPTPTFIQKFLIVIHRNGSIQDRGVVHVTVFCSESDYSRSKPASSSLAVTPWETNWQKSIGIGPTY